MGRVATIAALVAAAAVALQGSPGAAQGPLDPVQQAAVEQSCRALAGGTAGVPDQTANAAPGSFPAIWPEAPRGSLPAHVYFRTGSETFNRLYEFVTRGGQIYGRARNSADPWRRLPLPLCFAGHVASISLDDDEMIALDDARRVYTMDNALKDPAGFNWTNRWGTPVWGGPGYTLPDSVIAWSWSVISPVEDKRWTDPAGNHPAVGSGKVSHIWSLRSGGRRLTFNDPWLPLDQSYEMCGPLRGRFRAVNLSASGSEIFVIGARGDLFTRLYDFDLSGHDAVFFKYSYDDQRGKGDGAPIQLPAAPWVKQPKIRGRITSTISVEKTGVDAVHRILRVEGERRGHTGYWERDVASRASAGWRFHRTDAPLTGRRLANPRRDTARRALAGPEDFAYRMSGSGKAGTCATSIRTAHPPICACATTARRAPTCCTRWTACASRRGRAGSTTTRATTTPRWRDRAGGSRASRCRRRAARSSSRRRAGGSSASRKGAPTRPYDLARFDP